jgi:hypothetical protein
MAWLTQKSSSLGMSSTFVDRVGEELKCLLNGDNSASIPDTRDLQSIKEGHDRVHNNLKWELCPG